MRSASRTAVTQPAARPSFELYARTWLVRLNLATFVILVLSARVCCGDGQTIASTNELGAHPVHTVGVVNYCGGKARTSVKFYVRAGSDHLTDTDSGDLISTDLVGRGRCGIDEPIVYSPRTLTW